jgi:hypothetical protein
MGHVTGFCGEALVQEIRDMYQGMAGMYEGRLESPEEIRASLGDDREPTTQRMASDGLIYLQSRTVQAFLEVALGAKPATVCAVCQDGVERCLPYIEALDWETPFEHRVPVEDSEIEKVVKRTGGEVVDDFPFGKAVCYHAKPCYGAAMPRGLLWAALLSGEADLATRVVSVGSLREPSDDPDPTNMVACLVKGDDAAAEAYVQAFHGAYSDDAETPVQRHELPVGILRRDEGLIASGLRETTARYRAMWDPERYRGYTELGLDWLDPEDESFEAKLKAVARDLLTFGWVLSDYALACMVLAVRRGLTASLDGPELWSEWVPREIVLAATGLG